MQESGSKCESLLWGMWLGPGLRLDAPNRVCKLPSSQEGEGGKDFPLQAPRTGKGRLVLPTAPHFSPMSAAPLSESSSGLSSQLPELCLLP